MCIFFIFNRNTRSIHIYGVQGDMTRPCGCCGHALGRLLFHRRTFKIDLISRQSVIVPASKAPPCTHPHPSSLLVLPAPPTPPYSSIHPSSLAPLPAPPTHPFSLPTSLTLLLEDPQISCRFFLSVLVSLLKLNHIRPFPHICEYCSQAPLFHTHAKQVIC